MTQTVKQAAMLQAEGLIQAIKLASAADLAEINTLRAGVYLAQAWSDGVIDKADYDHLTRTACEALRCWLPRKAASNSDDFFPIAPPSVP